MAAATTAAVWTPSRAHCNRTFTSWPPISAVTADSDWAKGSSYSLSDYVYDLTCLLRSAAVAPNSNCRTFDGRHDRANVCWGFSGPSIASCRLGRCDSPAWVAARPIHERITEWVSQLDKIAERKTRYFRSIAEAAERISAHNKRLTSEQALHLANHGVRQNADGDYSWKFDEYQSARAPYRLSPNDHVVLWSRITCPTLLLRGDESFLPDPETAGVLAHFRQAHLVTVAGAGHWLHHDKLDEVLGVLRPIPRRLTKQ